VSARAGLIWLVLTVLGAAAGIVGGHAIASGVL
jgi:hypothetical protein